MKMNVAAALAVFGSLAAGPADAVVLWGKVASEARQRALEASWSQELEPTGSEARKRVSPVKRVVNLLTKMRAELDAEAEKESEMYDKMVCWCSSSEKEKTQAVTDAEAKDKDLGAEIEGRAARFGKLGTNIAQLKEDIGTNTASLRQASAIREKEAGEFRQEEKDTVQAVTNLKNAITVLSKHQEASLLQLDPPVLSGMRVLLRDTALKYDMMVASRAERQMMGHAAPHAVGSSGAAALLQGASSGSEGAAHSALLSALDVHGAPVFDELPVGFAARMVAQAAASPPRSGAFLQKTERQPIYSSRSSARSSGIYGVLTQMLEEFEAQLTTAQKEDILAHGSFSKLSEAKTSEIQVGKEKLDNMEGNHANNQKALSDAKENLGLVRQQRSDDVEFLRNLKLTCNDLDDQWKKRSTTRAAESQAVAEAITILTEDDNREMLAKSVSFVQESSEDSSSTKARAMLARASEVLRVAAKSPDFDADDLLATWRGRAQSGMVGAAAGPRMQLSALAVSAKLDSFKKVQEMMDKMVVHLQQQQEDEVAHKANCTRDIDTNTKTNYKKGEMKKDLESNIDQLEAAITGLTEEIADSEENIKSAKVDLKNAGERRKEENTEFQRVVADQQATQNILRKALGKLKDFYHKGINNAVALVDENQTPPVKFETYKNNAASSPVVGLIEQIIGDSEQLVSESTADEQKAQADYESFVQSSNKAIKNLLQGIDSKNKNRAGMKSDKATAGSDLDNTNNEIESLMQYKADLHTDCDFTLKNFVVRQKARLQEMDAVRKAKAILSGSGATEQA